MSDSRRVWWGLARSEFLVGWRSPGFRAAAAVCAAAAGVSCAAEGTTASLAGYLVSQHASTLIGIVALLWMCNAACRDAWMNADELVMVKPQCTEAILIGRLVGNLGIVYAVALAALVTGALVQVTWGGTPFILTAYVDAFVRSVVPLFTLSVLGFSLCTLFGTPVAGGVVALYWILVIAGRDFISRIFNFTLTQNHAVYALLSAGVFTLTLLLYRRDRRGENRWPRGLAGGASALLCGGIALAVVCVLTRHDPPLHTSDGMLAIASQHLEPGHRLPGFWLPGGERPHTGLYCYEGRVIAVGLWSPAVPESLGVLETLRRLQEAYGNQGVQAIAVCIHEDMAVAGHFARENRYPFPMLYDPGARQTEPPSAGSPVAEAYDASSLPKLVVADRDRLIRLVESGEDPERSRAPEVVQQIVSAP